MAAGDVVISKVEKFDRRGVIVVGTVTLDGSNPTPVDLSKYMSAIRGANVDLKSASAPGDDPSWVSVDWSGATLNVYAWKNTGGTDPTLVASTNNAAIFAFTAIGD